MYALYKISAIKPKMATPPTTAQNLATAEVLLETDVADFHPLLELMLDDLVEETVEGITAFGRIDGGGAEGKVGCDFKDEEDD